MWKRGEVATLIARSFLVIAQPPLTVRAAFILHTPGEREPRPGKLAIVVPKYIGTAPVRNRCKRRIRALMQQPLKTMPYDIVVFVRRTFVSLSYAELATLFEHVQTSLVLS